MLELRGKEIIARLRFLLSRSFPATVQYHVSQ